MSLVTFKATTRKLPEGIAVESESRGFKVILDEPPALGGNDRGMNPVELLLCSLGSCMTVVASFYAAKSDVSIRDLRVEIEGDLDPQGFMGGGASRAGLQEIRYKMFFKTDSPAANVERLVEMMKTRCPVGDSLANGVKLTPAGFEIEK
ncbi:MAG: OsmC family protein [Bacillota bacterium]